MANIDKNKMDVDPNETKTEDKIPPYVCCVLTEGTWTWFAAILFFAILMLIATLKYCRKHLSQPKFKNKNLSLLKRTLIEDDGDALGKIRLTPVKVEEFIKYCATRRKHAIIDTLEYDKTVHEDSQSNGSCLTATKNWKKNQNQAVVADDGNRVVLKDQDNDYINATRLISDDGEGYLDRTWIVTQGPLENTIEDFWSLVWQEDTRVVVMLTKTFEVVRLMCSQYWPVHMNVAEDYGALKVELLREERYAHYNVRHIKLTHKNEARYITQFHYTSWPLSAQPDKANLLLFRKHIISYLGKEDDYGPPLVHCHDGGGRSGTFLAIEANLTMVETRGQVDILGSVIWLHRQRSQLVSNSGFYRLIYDILEDHIKCGDTSRNMHDVLIDQDIKVLTNEFNTLASLRPYYSIGDCAAGHRAENRDKNRNVLVVPPDDSRPYLASFQSNSTTDYINAVFVDGFCQAKAMIVTEWPMQSTVANFWSMIYDHDCSTIVVLNNPPVPNKVTRHNKSFVRFWPEDGYSSYGPVFSINTVDMKNHHDFTMWHFRLGKKEIAPHRKFHAISMDDKKNKKENNNASATSLSAMLLQGLEAPAKLVKLYQINTWPQESQVPENPGVLISLMGEIECWHETVRENHMNSDGSSNHPNRIAVVSCDGMARSGVYSAAFTAVEQVAATRKVDIFNAVKCTRKSRPQLVDSLTEYVLIHDTVKQFVDNITK